MFLVMLVFDYQVSTFIWHLALAIALVSGGVVGLWHVPNGDGISPI